MTQEHRYSLTRVCLRRGELSLPRSLTGLFAPDSTVEVTDSTSGHSLEIRSVGERVLQGLAPFFEEHGLEVNDQILIRSGRDGAVTLTPLRRERTPRPGRVDREEIVRTVLAAGPVTEAEARALLPGLPADFRLAALLQESGRFQLRGGRWHDAAAAREAEFAREVDEALAQASPVRHTEAAPAATGVRQVLGRVGFQVSDLGDGMFMLDSASQGSSAPGFRVLGCELQPGVRLDWAVLLERRRQAAADHLAVFGAEGSVESLAAPAELAHATLWTTEAVSNIGELVRNLPICPVDLEPYFRTGGMTGEGRDRFERQIQARIAERGAFSTVLANLAVHPGPAGFRLEDAARGVDRDTALRILDQLSRSPFQLVIRREGGDWYLRENVQTALRQLAEYASSLQDHMPRSRQQLAVQRG